MNFVPGIFNYLVVVFLMMAGFYVVIAQGNLVKKLVGLGLFQASVFILYITMGNLAGGQAPIVAEDLGVITPEVDRLRHNHGLPGMKVLQFEAGNPDFRLDEIEKNCVCYTGTHDNDTTVGWFNGGDEDTRSEHELLETRKNVLNLTGGTRETIHLDMIRLAFESPARLAIAPLQDFLGLGSEARLNTPGTTMNNWRWRVTENQLSAQFCESVAEMVGKSARN